VVSLDFSVTCSFRPYHGRGVDTAPSEKEYQEHFLRGKGGRCLRLTTSPRSRAECHEIWEPKPHGTLWATPGFLRDSFTFTFTFYLRLCCLFQFYWFLSIFRSVQMAYLSLPMFMCVFRIDYSLAIVLATFFLTMHTSSLSHLFWFHCLVFLPVIVAIFKYHIFNSSCACAP